MKDTEIIDLFWKRDESAIQELKTNILDIAIKLHGICWKTMKIRKNA